MPASTLKIYLHDGTRSFRIQLVGDLKVSDLNELNGCWRTARSSVLGRPLVLDVTKLKSTDEAGTEWIGAMLSENAQILDGREVTAETPTRLRVRPDGSQNSSGTLQIGRWRSFVSNLQRNLAPGPAQAKEIDARADGA
jgi:hypothetical protein